MTSIDPKAATAAKPNVVLLQAGKTQHMPMREGQHLVVRKAGASGDVADAQIPDNLVATRQGDALHLRYADSSEIIFDDFYNVCGNASICSVNVAADDAAGFTLGGENALGAGVSADGGTLVYAHGSNDVLMAMAQGQSGMSSAIGALGSAPSVTYLPGLLAASGMAVGETILGALTGAAIASGGVSGSDSSPLLSGNLQRQTADYISRISNAAQSNTAATSQLSLGDYAGAGVTGVNAGNLQSINSTLDSSPVDGTSTNNHAPTRLRQIPLHSTRLLAKAPTSKSPTSMAMGSKIC